MYVCTHVRLSGEFLNHAGKHSLVKLPGKFHGNLSNWLSCSKK